MTGVVYRHPGVLIKTVTTLDVLSGGRAYLGIGAAWNEREAQGLGIPFPPLRERFERLEETLQIAKHLWSGNPDPFEGRHYQLAEPISSPQPLTRPHPPILIGGSGEKKTLRFVAQYGDACNLFSRRGAAAVQAKLDVLKRHCEEVGRDYADDREDDPGDRPTGGGSYELRRDRRSVSHCSAQSASSTRSSTCQMSTRSAPSRPSGPRSSRPWPSSRTRAEMAAVASYGGDSISGNASAISRLGNLALDSIASYL